jgi:uncharacterized membrane protein
MISPQLQQKINQGYDFRTGDYISKGFELFQRNAGGFILFTIVYFIIALVIGIIPLGSIISSIIVSPCLLAGVYLVANKVRQNEATEFGDFFRGFDYVKDLALYQLIVTIVIFALLVPLVFILGFAFLQGIMQAQSGKFDPEIFSGLAIGVGGIVYFLFFFLAVLVMSVALIFTSQFIVFHGLPFMEAMESSVKLVMANFFSVLIFGIALFFINIIGAIPCGLGLLVTFPLSYCAVHVAFADIVGAKEKDAMDF